MAEKKETQYAVVEQMLGTGVIVQIWWFDARKTAREFRADVDEMRKRATVRTTKLVVKPMKRGPRA